MDLSIVIVNWNTRDLLSQCLSSVFANPPERDWEVLVVDNASDDNSAAMMHDRFPMVRLIENSKNEGFVRANNRAVPLTSGRYVMLLNSDTIVQPGALTGMIKFMNAHLEAGIVGSYILNADGTPQRCFGAFPSVWSETVYAWGLDSRRPFSTWYKQNSTFTADAQETGWVLGATMMIRRNVLDQIGLLDERFFMYSEEVDLCYRVSKAGWKNYVLRDAKIIHLGGQSTQQIPAPMKAELFRSKVKYFQKHYGNAVARILEFILATSILSRCWIYFLCGRRHASEIWAEAWQSFIHQQSM